jgi:hypothetical protein
VDLGLDRDRYRGAAQNCGKHCSVVKTAIDFYEAVPLFVVFKHLRVVLDAPVELDFATIHDFSLFVIFQLVGVDLENLVFADRSFDNHLLYLVCFKNFAGFG